MVISFCDWYFTCVIPNKDLILRVDQPDCHVVRQVEPPTQRNGGHDTGSWRLRIARNGSWTTIREDLLIRDHISPRMPAIRSLLPLELARERYASQR